jgi:DNA mismatch repair protein MutL
VSTRPEIRLLEDRVVDQIAAGEVVERPASVVKELVENALDARAHHIVVTLEDGGRERIRVEDDGHGMSESEALLAIERHATSKLRRVEDLDGVRTLGFRGEALPSIAAVSRFQLVTRADDEEAGTRIRLDAGRLVDVRPTGAPVGTSIDVRALFHALPARRAFLRSAPTESSHAAEAVRRVAFVRPDVAFEVRAGERVAVRAPVAPDLAERARALLGAEVQELVPFDEQGPLGHLVGWWAPGVHRASIADGVHAYVHGRWVRDRVLRNAVQAALRERTPSGRSPLLLLDLRPPPGGVDVNVHPTKSEVRFRDPAGVSAWVTEALSRAVGRPRTRPGPGERATLTLLPPPRVPALPPGPLPPPVPHEPPPDPTPDARPPPAPPLAAEPPAARAEARVLAVLRARWVVADELEGVAVYDGGRWLRRRQAAVAGEGPRLVVPVRVTLPARDVAVVEVARDALEHLGLRVAVLSPTEVVVRSTPASLADAPAAALVHAAIGALRRDGDVRRAWGEELPPAPVTAGALPPGPPPDDLRVGRVGLP